MYLSQSKNIDLYFAIGGSTPVNRIELSCRGQTPHFRSGLVRDISRWQENRISPIPRLNICPYSHIWDGITFNSGNFVKKDFKIEELVKLLPLTHLDDMVERDFVVFHLSQSLTVRDPSKVSRAVDPTICRKLARRGLLSQLLPQLVCKKVCPYNNLYNQNIFVKKPVWTFLSWVVSQTILLSVQKQSRAKSLL